VVHICIARKWKREIKLIGRVIQWPSQIRDSVKNKVKQGTVEEISRKWRCKEHIFASEKINEYKESGNRYCPSLLYSPRVITTLWGKYA
jgi:hypothetical protein